MASLLKENKFLQVQQRSLESQYQTLQQPTEPLFTPPSLSSTYIPHILHSSPSLIPPLIHSSKSTYSPTLSLWKAPNSPPKPTLVEPPCPSPPSTSITEASLDPTIGASSVSQMMLLDDKSNTITSFLKHLTTPSNLPIVAPSSPEPSNTKPLIPQKLSINSL